MAANSDNVVRRAARLADTWMINPHATRDTIARQLKTFRVTQTESGADSGGELPAMREIFCAKDRASALAQAEPYLAEKYLTYAKWGQDQVMPDRESFWAPYEQLAEQRFIVGSVEDCIEALLPWRDEFGVNHFIFRTHWAGMAVADSLRSIDLLTKEVIPVLREQGSN